MGLSSRFFQPDSHSGAQGLSAELTGPWPRAEKLGRTGNIILRFKQFWPVRRHRRYNFLPSPLSTDPRCRKPRPKAGASKPCNRLARACRLTADADRMTVPPDGPAMAMPPVPLTMPAMPMPVVTTMPVMIVTARVPVLRAEFIARLHGIRLHRHRRRRWRRWRRILRSHRRRSEAERAYSSECDCDLPHFILLFSGTIPAGECVSFHCGISASYAQFTLINRCLAWYE